MNDEEPYAPLTEPAPSTQTPPVPKPRRTSPGMKTEEDAEGGKNSPPVPSRDGRQPLGPDGRLSKMKIRRKGQKLGERPTKAPPPAPVEEEEEEESTVREAPAPSEEVEAVDDLFGEPMLPTKAEPNTDEFYEKAVDSPAGTLKAGDEIYEVIDEDSPCEGAKDSDAKAGEQQVSTSDGSADATPASNIGDTSSPKGDSESPPSDEDSNNVESGEKDSREGDMDTGDTEQQGESNAPEKQEDAEADTGADAETTTTTEDATSSTVDDSAEKSVDGEEAKPSSSESAVGGPPSVPMPYDKSEAPSPQTSTSRPASAQKKKKGFFGLFQKGDSRASMQESEFLEKVRSSEKTTVGEATSSVAIPKRKDANYLPLSKGEVLKVIEMATCSPGTWVCMNKDDVVGFVKTTEVTMDPLSMRNFFDVIPKKAAALTNKEGVPLEAKVAGSTVQILSAEEAQMKAKELSDQQSKHAQKKPASDAATASADESDKSEEKGSNADKDADGSSDTGPSEEMSESPAKNVSMEGGEGDANEEEAVVDTTPVNTTNVPAPPIVSSSSSKSSSQPVVADATTTESSTDAASEFGDAIYEPVDDSAKNAASEFGQSEDALYEDVSEETEAQSQPYGEQIYETVDNALQDTRPVSKYEPTADENEMYEDMEGINLPSNVRPSQPQGELDIDGLYMVMNQNH